LRNKKKIPLCRNSFKIQSNSRRRGTIDTTNTHNAHSGGT